MSPEKCKSNKIRIYRTHYPLYHEPNPDKEKRAIARKSIINRYKKIGISLNLDEVTLLD